MLCQEKLEKISMFKRVDINTFRENNFGEIRIIAQVILITFLKESQIKLIAL